MSHPLPTALTRLEPDQAGTPASNRHRQERFVAAVASVVAAVYALAVRGSALVHTDHLAYLGTIERMHAGESFYSAYMHAYAQDAGILMGRPRGFREPAIFLVWRLIPTSALFAVFLAMIVLTTYLLAKVSVRPAAALVPGVFLILASRTTITEWLLVEFWTLPLLAGSILAWKREKWWTAAALAAIALALRETAAPLLLAGLVIALLRRKPWQPWAICGTVALVAFSVNDFIASRYVVDHGNDAVLAGTGRSFGTVVEMMAWPFQNEAVVALCFIVLWMAAIWFVTRSEEWLPLVGLLAIPVLGFAVHRGYWGLLATPFALLLVADGVLAHRPTPADISTPLDTSAGPDVLSVRGVDQPSARGPEGHRRSAPLGASVAPGTK